MQEHNIVIPGFLLQKNTPAVNLCNHLFHHALSHNLYTVRKLPQKDLPRNILL